MGFSAAPAGAGQASAAAIPTYDEQIGTTFTEDLTALAYNVTALAQADADGYGPAYLLNGLTSSGYWYQVGISYHWPSSDGSYNPTFGFSYQVYGPSGKSVFPSPRGAGLSAFSKAVHSGDSVLLSLTFSGSSVQMLAEDWDTGATAKTSFTSVGASSFVGNPSGPSNSLGFFSGLMTEWYHVLPYSGNVGKVVYSNQAFALSSAWMWIDELDTGNPGAMVFINQTRTPVTFANDQQLYPFASHGVTMYSSAHQFITGLLNATSSRVELTPATAESAPPSFAASYTLAGLHQSAEVAAGTGAVVQADPGTSVTISVNSSASSAVERWVFSGTGATAVTAVTFAAGSNVTYVYYHLVQQTVAYQLVGGGRPPPAGFAPELVYEEPPATPSATPSRVVVTRQLGSSPVEIFVLRGSTARLSGGVPEEAGERWAASSPDWVVSGPNAIPYPVKFYDQYQVSIGYSILGGGAPPEPPVFMATSLGSAGAIPLSTNATTTTTGWFDAGSVYSFSSLLNGTAADERWVDGLAGDPGGGALLIISSPNQALTAAYVHQYYADLAVNDARGGQISQGPGWLDAGSRLSASASASPQWRFEMWNGSGADAYTGPSPSIDLVVSGPLAEEATFYVQLSVAADPGIDVDFSYGSVYGTVHAGSARTVYVPPSVNVTMRASPSLFVYSFASWKGTGLANATRPSLSFVVSSPGAVIGTSSYNYLVLIGIAAAAAVIVLACSLWIRGRRRRPDLVAFPPGAAQP